MSIKQGAILKDDRPHIGGDFAKTGADVIVKGQEHFVPMDDGFPLRCLEFGNSSASNTVIVFHGGPGAGISPNDLRLIQNANLEKNRFIVFSQPYCLEYVGLDRYYYKADSRAQSECDGLSSEDRIDYHIRSFSKIREMTFDRMIDYVDQARVHFCGDKPVSVWGGSAGGCLAMKYAIDFPQHVERVLGRATSLFELCGSMNPDDVAATQRQWDHNPYFQKFVEGVRSFCGENFPLKDIMHKLYHGMYDLQGQKWSNDQKMEAAVLWRSWNLALAYSHGADDHAIEQQVQRLVRDQPEHALVFTAIFTAALEQEYEKFGPEYLEEGLKAIKLSHPHIRVDYAHGADDEICPVSNAKKAFMWHSGGSCSYISDHCLVSADERTRYFSATGGHFVKEGGGLDAVVSAVLSDWAGNYNPLREIYPDMGSGENAVLIISSRPVLSERETAPT